MRWLRAHPYLAAATVLVGAVVGLLTFFVAVPAARFREIASEPFTPELAAVALDREVPVEDSPPSTISIEEYSPEVMRFMEEARPLELSGLELAMMGSPALPDDMFTSILLIGADASGALADSIVLVLLPNDGATPIMASIPRDMWLPNRCTEGFTRINENLNGCDDLATGPELLALAVEDFTGISVDHYARVNFGGFASVIDWMGGVTVCVDAATRDAKSHLSISGGCSTVGGATALAWVRSRHTETLIGGSWKAVPASDFSRQTHQQDVLLQLAEKLAGYRSPTTLAEALEQLSSAVKMDSGWSISQIAALGFRHRDLDLDDVIRIRLETEDYVSGGGAFVLLPSEPFNATIASVYPDAKIGG